MISPTQRPLSDNTGHSQKTNIHAPYNPCKRRASNPRLKPRGYWDRQLLIVALYNRPRLLASSAFQIYHRQLTYHFLRCIVGKMQVNKQRNKGHHHHHHHHHWHNSPFRAKDFSRSFCELSLFLGAFLQFLSPNFVASSICNDFDLYRV